MTEDRVFIWRDQILYPTEGWFAFALIIGIVSQYLSNFSLEDFHTSSLIGWTAILLCSTISYVLIKRPNSLGFSLFLSSWTAILSAIFTMLPVPIGRLIDREYLAFAEMVETNWLLFSSELIATVNAGEWVSALVFSLAGVLLSGPISTLFFWLLFRRKTSVLAMGCAVATAGAARLYNRDENLFPLYALIVLAILFIAVWQQKNREEDWAETETDFSENIRVTSGTSGFAVAFTVVMIGVICPAIPYAEIGEAIQDFLTVEGPGVLPDGSAAAGSGPPLGSQPTQNNSQQEVEPSTLLPTSYLVGNPPDLADSPVFEATISGLPADPTDFHWQEGSFDFYSGFGWSRSAETAISLAEAEIWQESPAVNEVVPVQQRITWTGNPRPNYLLAGQFQQINQSVTLFVRPENDFVRLRPDTPDVLPSYVVIGLTQVVDRQRLNNSSYDEIEESGFYERYTQLPPNISDRVLTLAEQITADATGPYEQAAALEEYLRRFPYNLDIDPPPAGREPVDYFLFDLQEGYCDLYATSMVVMARSLGLPARLGVGFNSVTPNEDGLVVITRDKGHSWPEIYFPEVGWVEFEPTASFPTSAEIESSSGFQSSEFELENPGQSTAESGQTNVVAQSLIWGLIGLLMLLIVFFISWTVWRINTQPHTAPQLIQQWLYRDEPWELVRQTAIRTGYQPAEHLTPREFFDDWSHILNADRTFIEKSESLLHYLEREWYGLGLSSNERQQMSTAARSVHQLALKISKSRQSNRDKSQ